jgi:hypothetical protein
MTRGCCQGSGLGPLIYSVFANSIGKNISCPLLSYSDDHVLYDSDTDTEKLLDRLSSQLLIMHEWCKENGVKINYTKTKFMIFHKPSDKSCNTDNLNSIKITNDIKIDRVYEHKYLGIIYDPHMSFSLHYNYITRKVISHLKYLYGIKRSLNEHVMKVMINAYVHATIDYGLEIWCVQTKAQVDTLQNRINRFLISYFYPSLARKQKRKGRLKKCNINTTELLKKCNFLTVQERRDFVSLKSAFRDYKNSKLPLSTRSLDSSRPLMESVNVKCELYKKSLYFRTKTLWNDLPRNFKINDLTYLGFKTKIIDHIISKRLVSS